MKWNDFNLLQKSLLIVLLFLAILGAPEFIMFLDLGGLDLAISLLLFNLLAIKTWLFEFKHKVQDIWKLVILTLSQTQLARKEIFFSNFFLAVSVLYVTSSLAIATSIMLAPAFIINAIPIAGIY
jgi:hypothetical protein